MPRSVRALAFFAALAVSSALGAACPSKGGRPDDEGGVPTADFLVGTWEDVEGTRVTFERSGSAVRVREIVAADHESYEVRAFTFEGGRASYSFYVPSTQVLVTVRILDSEGDELDADWTNSAGHSGAERLVRLRHAPGA